MGRLKYLCIHCADTPSTMTITKEMLEEWHMSPKPHGRGWDRLGYSDIIHQDGTITNLTPYDEDQIITNAEMTWGATGINSVSRHVVLEGGWYKDEDGVNHKSGTFDPKDLYSEEQLKALDKYIVSFISKHPQCEVIGHRDTKTTKTCPNFDVKEYFKNIKLW